MKKTFKIILNIIYAVVVLYLSLFIIISLAMPGKTTKYLGFGWYKVASGSMEPMIMTEDVIVAYKVLNPYELKDGDVILFETYIYVNGSYQRKIVTHHFSHITEEGYVITYPHREFEKNKEDRIYDHFKMNDNEEYHVTINDIIGKLWFILP